MEARSTQPDLDGTISIRVADVQRAGSCGQLDRPAASFSKLDDQATGTNF